MNVEIGAGVRPAPGFLAVDVNPWGSCDVLASAEALPFADGSVTAMRAVDVLEHISFRDTSRVLAEWARVCARGASLYVQVPDAREIAKWYLERDDRIKRYDQGKCPPIVGMAWRLLGGHRDGKYVDEEGDWRWNAHYSLWDDGWLTVCLGMAGFEITSLHTNGHPNLCCDAVRR